jgi:hypothetical protein
VEPFFHENQYFLFVNETFKDVRLVGAPPSAIGKFGGDTDNWMWPRHTGDFSIFRIYANKNNEPAEYSKDNQPYKSEKHFPISLKGVNENDFTMVFGYPRSTNQYVPSFHLEMLTETVYPQLIKMRTRKLNIMETYMEKDPAVRIQYSAKSASVSNAWKRWRGEIRGLNTLNAVDKKKDYETRFMEWVDANTDRQMRYGNLISEYETVYPQLEEIRLARDLLLEVIYRNGIEVARVAAMFRPLVTLYEKNNPDDDQIETIKEKIKKDVQTFFKDYHQPIDHEITGEILDIYQQSVNETYWPELYDRIEQKHKGNISKYADQLFNTTMFANESSALALLEGFSQKSAKKVKKDQAWQLYNNFMDINRDILAPVYNSLSQKTDSLNRLYMQAIVR